MQYKIRKLSFSIKGSEVKERNFSVTIPKEIIKLIGSETKFFIDYNPASKTITLSSGTSIFPTAKEVENFSFQECTV